ncbi:MAG TPA: SgcJ/EcaC family oxidoreductase [Cytophagales bacterium]|nr:SgcJ/EcaC family oxidoreductase [Cytophagales bacterium]
MKNNLIGFLIFVLIHALGSCSQKSEQSGKDPAVTDTTAIQASIDSLGGVVQKAHDTGNDSLLALTWAKDGILIVSGNEPIKGREAIVSYFGNMPPLPPGGKMKINPIELKILGPEWVYVLGIDTLTYTPEGSSKEIKETSTFSVLVKKTSEGWQTYRETLSPNSTLK